MVASSRGKPAWLTIRPPKEKFFELRKLIKFYGLNTVCAESHCPNIPECWSGGTATFMILGKYCTRRCRFCNVESRWPQGIVDATEPERLGGAVSKMNLGYIVITSVDRDDLPDQGSEHFAKCIIAVKEKCPEIRVEVLIPDFRGNLNCLKKVVEAKPDVIAHNIETVERLQSSVRDRRAGYEQSLFALGRIKKMNPEIFTKSSIIVGLGEMDQEVLQTMKDLRAVEVDFLTIGQYLRPSDWHLPVAEYVTPEKFEFFKMMGEDLGFAYVAAGPFVRTSYRAGEFFVKSSLQNRKQSLQSLKVIA